MSAKWRVIDGFPRVFQVSKHPSWRVASNSIIFDWHVFTTSIFFYINGLLITLNLLAVMQMLIRINEYQTYQTQLVLNKLTLFVFCGNFRVWDLSTLWCSWFSVPNANIENILMKNVPCQLVNQPWWPNNIGAIFRPNLILHPPLLNRVYYIQHYGENGTNKVDMLDRETAWARWRKKSV